tara:strand:+ start:412 stop:726 length:315 start_codon:yes stop_codon:yes gene_type:complete
MGTQLTESGLQARLRLAAMRESPLSRVVNEAKNLSGHFNTVDSERYPILLPSDEIKDYIAQHNYIVYKLNQLVRDHCEMRKDQIRKTATTADKEAELLDKYPDL